MDFIYETLRKVNDKRYRGSSVQGTGMKNIFDPSELLGQAFLVGVAKEKFQHLLIGFDAVRKRILAEERSLIRGIVTFEIEISGAPPFRPFVRRVLRFPAELKELQCKPGIFFEQTVLDGKGMVGRNDAGFPEIIDHHLVAAIVE